MLPPPTAWADSGAGEDIEVAALLPYRGKEHLRDLARLRRVFP